MYQTWRIDQAQWACIAHYSAQLLDPLTKAAPAPRADPAHHNSEARALCSVHAINKLIDHLVPIAAADIHAWVDSLPLPAPLSDADTTTALAGGDTTPHVIGSLVAMNIIADMATDGLFHSSHPLPLPIRNSWSHTCNSPKAGTTTAA